jgi:hypothetical protein
VDSRTILGFFFRRTLRTRLRTPVKGRYKAVVEDLRLSLDPIRKSLSIDLAALFVKLLGALPDLALNHADHKVLLLFTARLNVHCYFPRKTIYLFSLSL